MPDPALVCFAHGKESGPWGSKIRHLAAIAQARGWAVDSRDYRGIDDPAERLALLLADPPQAQRLVLCGSSMGGYVSAMACRALQPQGLFLMAPALYLPGYAGEPAGCPRETAVVHGQHDTVVPWDNALRFARTHGAELHLLDDGHRLADSLPLLGLLFGAMLDRLAAQ